MYLYPVNMQFHVFNSLIKKLRYLIKIIFETLSFHVCYPLKKTHREKKYFLSYYSPIFVMQNHNSAE